MSTYAMSVERTDGASLRTTLPPARPTVRSGLDEYLYRRDMRASARAVASTPITAAAFYIESIRFTWLR